MAGNRRGFLATAMVSGLAMTFPGGTAGATARRATAYLGGYTGDGGPGLVASSADRSTGALTREDVVAVTNPSWLARNGKRLYAVDESSPEGGVIALTLEHGTTPRVLNTRRSGGDTPTHCSVHRDHLVSSNYGSGSVVVHPIAADGSLLAASDLVEHGDGAHAHQTLPDPSGEWLLSVDIGVDLVIVYRLRGGKLLEHQRFPLPHGSGPRHIAFHPNGRIGYLVHEYESFVTVFHWDRATGAVRFGQVIGTRAGDATGENAPAEAAVSVDGRFVYVSNRGDNSVTWFGTSDDGGTLTKVGTVSVGGVWPRHVALHGGHLYSANQRSGTVTWLRRDAATGELSPSTGALPVAAVSMVLFA